jgi:hypothetical protein
VQVVLEVVTEFYSKVWLMVNFSAYLAYKDINQHFKSKKEEKRGGGGRGGAAILNSCNPTCQLKQYDRK